MTIWKPETLPRERPLYREIADVLAEAIHRGELAAGEQLPTHRDLARRLGVNVVTVTRGYAEAARRGLVEGEVGRGTFVREQGDPTGPLQPLAPGRPGLVDLGFNLPVSNPDLLDTRALFEELSGSPDGLPILAGYSAAGMQAHREAGAALLGRSGLDASPQRVAVTGGAQHAMALAVASLAAPGDVLLAEELTYPGIHALGSVLNLRVQGVPMDAEGLLPDALDEACTRNRPKALYTMPTVHNPLGSVLSAERRAAIARVARRHGLAIVEDDTYAFLCPDPPPPLATFAPELTTFVTSLSKSFSAGLRTGFLLLPEDGGPTGLSIERIAGRVAAVGWMASPVTTELAARWIRDGTVDAMIRWKRREATARRKIFDRVIGAPVGSHRGSCHVWLPLPTGWHVEDYVAEARRRGVAVSPSNAFAAARTSVSPAVRVCLGTPPTREETERGLRVLGSILEGGPAVYHTLV